MKKITRPIDIRTLFNNYNKTYHKSVNVINAISNRLAP